MFSRLATTAIRRAAPAARVAPSASVLSSARFAPIAIRSYAGGPDIMSKTGVEARVLDIFRTFDKVNQDKLNLDAEFTKDLGLDSLDSVEVIMAIEEDFSIEIPDAEADEIRTVRQAVDYIIRTPEAE